MKSDLVRSSFNDVRRRVTLEKEVVDLRRVNVDLAFKLSAAYETEKYHKKRIQRLKADLRRAKRL
jgi:hypothetical protein